MKKLIRDQGAIIILSLLMTLLLFANLFVMSIDVFWTVFFISFAIIIFPTSTKSKYSKAKRVFSILIFFHFLFFPYLYVILLKNNPESFLVDSTIERNEIDIAKLKLEETFNIHEIRKRKEIINNLINSNYSYLDSFCYVLDTNQLIIDTLKLYKTYKPVGKGPSAPGNILSIATLSIAFNNENESMDFEGDYEDTISNSTIRFFLNDKLKEIESTSNEFLKQLKKIEDKDVWNYSTILAYSINILNTDNLKPKTKLSNVVFFIHQIVFGIIIATGIGTAFYDLAIDIKKQSSKY